MRYYGYSEFLKDINTLSSQIKSFDPDAILAVARGGVTIGHFLAESLNLRSFYTINSIHYDDEKKLDYIKLFNIPNLHDYKKVLIVDDIVDSGDTLFEIVKIMNINYPTIDFKTTAIFQKKSAKHTADFWAQEANDWIEFFWSKDLK